MQDQTEKVHRNELVQCICENDEVARREASKDTKELFIEEVLITLVNLKSSEL